MCLLKLDSATIHYLKNSKTPWDVAKTSEVRAMIGRKGGVSGKIGGITPDTGPGIRKPVKAK